MNQERFKPATPPATKRKQRTERAAKYLGPVEYHATEREPEWSDEAKQLARDLGCEDLLRGWDWL